MIQNKVIKLRARRRGKAKVSSKKSQNTTSRQDLTVFNTKMPDANGGGTLSKISQMSTDLGCEFSICKAFSSNQISVLTRNRLPKLFRLHKDHPPLSTS